MKKIYPLALILALPFLLLSQDGELDLSFNGDGKFHHELKNTNDVARRVVLQPDGKLLLLGTSNSTSSSSPIDILIYRLNTGGNPDPKFGNQGLVRTDFGTYDALGFAGAVQADGKILAAGRARESSGSGSKYGVGLVRLMDNGSPDYSFGDSSKVYFPMKGNSGQSYHFVQQRPDGKIVVGGDFFNGGRGVAVLVGFNANGTPDYAFGDSAIATIESPGSSLTINRLVNTPNGKIAGVGRMYINSQSQLVVVQFDANGNPDVNFGSNGVALVSSATSANGYGVVGQADGKVVVCGYVEKNGLNYFAVTRLLADGTLDQSFGINGQASAPILNGDATAEAVHILGDGKIMLAGTANGIWNDDFAVARFTSAGTLDQSFSIDGYVTKNMGNGTDDVYDAVLQPNGRLVVVGRTVYNHNQSGSGSFTNDFVAARFLAGKGTIGVDELEEGNFQLFPNPAKDFIQLRFDEEVNLVELKLMDQRGSVVKELSGTGQEEVKMELSGVPTGLYMLQVAVDGSNLVYKKMVVE